MSESVHATASEARCDGCGATPVFRAAVDGGVVCLCSECRDVVAAVLEDEEDGFLECPHDDCDRIFNSRRKLRGHLGSSEHALDVPEGEFWCGYCGYGPTSWRGINAHHGSSNHDGDPVRLDEEPDQDDLIAPEDIISAEHGLFHPDTPIEYYERTPDDLEGVLVDPDERLPNGDEVTTLLDRWAVDVFEGLQQWVLDAAGGLDPRDVELEILLGTSYRDPLEDRDVFEALSAPASLTISFPFQEAEQAQGGNGNQMGWMTDAIEAVAGTDGGEARAE